MLKKKNFLRCTSALALSGILLLSAGCGSTQEPAADEPTPSQAVSTPAPSGTPETASTPAASPTDVNAPASRPPAPDISVEREAPASVSFLAYKVAFELTNAQGQTLSYDGTAVSGAMELLEQSEMSDASGTEIFYAQLPYSEHFTCRLPEELAQDRQWGFDMTEIHRTYFTARGVGNVDSIEYDAAGDLYVAGDAGSALDLTIGMPDSSLGERGWVRLEIKSGEEEVRLEARGNTLSYSGLEAGDISLSYGGGLFSGQGVTLKLTSGSGTLDISNIANGEVSVNAG